MSVLCLNMRIDPKAPGLGQLCLICDTAEDILCTKSHHMWRFLIRVGHFLLRSCHKRALFSHRVLPPAITSCSTFSFAAAQPAYGFAPFCLLRSRADLFLDNAESSYTLVVGSGLVRFIISLESCNHDSVSRGFTRHRITASLCRSLGNTSSPTPPTKTVSCRKSTTPKLYFRVCYSFHHSWKGLLDVAFQMWPSGRSLQRKVHRSLLRG